VAVLERQDTDEDKARKIGLQTLGGKWGINSRFGEKMYYQPKKLSQMYSKIRALDTLLLANNRPNQCTMRLLFPCQ